MPLSCQIGVVAGVFQKASERHHPFGQHALIVLPLALPWAQHLRDIRNARKMVIYAGHQHGAGRRAIRRRVIVRETNPLPREGT